MRALGNGPFHPGDRVQLTDDKGKMYSFYLATGGQWHSHKVGSTTTTLSV